MYGFHGGREAEMTWYIGTDIYTVLCIKWMTSKDLLYSTGNSTSILCNDSMGKESTKEGMNVYV